MFIELEQDKRKTELKNVYVGIPSLGTESRRQHMIGDTLFSNPLEMESAL